MLFIGIFSLSHVEAKKDLREIQILTDGDDDTNDGHSDSDSDCSFQSKDVLPSSYPVKPRKGYRINRGGYSDRSYPPIQTYNNISQPSIANSNSNSNEVFQMKLALEAFRYLKDVKLNYRDVYDIEEERSTCEQQLLSYRNSAFTLLREVKDSNLGQQNFIRLLQGLYIRALRLHSYNSKNNAMIYNILETIRRLKSYMELINDYGNNYQALATVPAQNNSGKRNSSKSKTNQQSNSNIQALINSAGIANGETNLLKVKVKKHEKEIVLFKGQCINTPMGMGTITCIKPKELKVVLKLPYGVLYAHVAKVVSWGNHGEVLDVTSSISLHKKFSGANNISIDQLTQLKINQIINESKSTTRDQTADTTDNDDENSNSKDDEETENAKNHMDDANDEEVEAEDEYPDKKIPKYPLQPGVTSNKRAEFSKLLSQESLTRPHSLIALPLVTIAPNTIPYVVDNIDKSYMNPNISINSHALNILKHSYCSSSHHVWNGTIDDYQGQIHKIKDEIMKLEKEQQEYMNQIQSYRMQCSQLTSDTATVRLGMYTRRMRHKTFLSSKGLQSPISGATTTSTVEALVSSSDKSIKHVIDDTKVTQVPLSQSSSNEINVPTNKKRNREQANLVINDKPSGDKSNKKESPPPAAEKGSESAAVNNVNNSKKKSRR